MAVLRWAEDPDRLYPIMGKVVSIGRSFRNDIVLDDTKVSRHHARIEERSGIYYVVDLESTNGVFVDGRQIEDEPLKEGNRVLIGSTILIFTEGADDQEKHLSKKLKELAGNLPADQENLARKLRVYSRRIEQMEKSDRLSSLLLEITRRLTSILDIRKLLAQTMDDLVKLTAAERGLIVLYDKKKKKLAPALARGIGKEIEADEREEISYSIVKEVYQTGVSVLTTDAQDDPRFSAGQSVFSFNIRSVMCAPLKSKKKILGVIYIDNRQESGMFSDVDLRFLEAFAAQTAVALENAMLYREITEDKSKIESILQSMDDAMVVADGQGTVDMMNPSARRLFEVEKASSGELYPCKSAQSHRLGVLLSEVMDVDESTTFDVFNMKPDPEMFSNRVTVLKRGKNKRTGAILALRNVTRMKDIHRSSIRFLYMVARHLEEKLAGIESAMEQDNGQKTGVSLSSIKDAVYRIIRFARMIAGPIRLHRSVHIPAEIFGDEIKKVEAELAERNISLECTGLVENWNDEITVDPDKMKDTMRFTLRSAADMAEEGSTLKASFLTKGKEMIMTIDISSMTAPDYVRRVLEAPSMQADMVDSVSSADELALMVDLAFSRFVLDAHGGALELENDNRICVRFPILQL